MVAVLDQDARGLIGVTAQRENPKSPAEEGMSRIGDFDLLRDRPIVEGGSKMGLFSGF